MSALKHLCRILHIGFVFFKHGLDDIMLTSSPSRLLNFLKWLSLSRWKGQVRKPRGVRLRKALEELGPIFVKFGQLLSTRYDILPEDILLELAKLQDNVPPFSGALAQKTIEAALAQPIEMLFQDFDITPLASASIAQVHAATLLDGQNVVIKILRPDIHKIIKQDVEILQMLAKLSYRYGKKIRQFKPCEMVAEFEKTLFNELDLMHEAANASQLRRNFLHAPMVYIPKIHWEFTKHNILVMERIYGISIANIDTLKQQGFNVKELAKRILEIFFTQVFRDSFFHADMHPGNILVDKNNPHQSKLLLVDFGIMGVLSPKDQQYLAQNILALLKHDYRKVAILHIEANWVPKHTRIDEFEGSIRTICEPIFAEPTKKISFGQLLFRLLQMATCYRINIQPQLILLQKTLLYIEGISRQLDPEIDLAETAKPFLENWMRNQIGIPAVIRKIKTHIPYWIEKLPEFSTFLHTTLTQITHSQNLDEFSVSSSITSTSSDGLTKTSIFSFKDICIGVSLGISLSVLWLVLRSYF